MTTAIAAPPAVRLRPYQQRCCQAVWDALTKRGVKRCGVSMPTGGGKTITAGSFVAPIVRHYKRRVLWLAHRVELLDQAEKAYQRLAPDLRITRWDATTKDDSGDVVLAMIGSTRTLKGDWLLIVIDETHHAAEADEEEGYTNMYAQLLERLTWAHIIGLSATMGRLDGRSLVLDEVVFSISFLDLVRMHRLSRPVYTEMLTDQRVQLQVRGGEFTKKSLTKLDNEQRNGKIADEWVQNKTMYGKTLMYVTSVAHCDSMKAAILKRDPTVDVRIMTGKNTKTERSDAQEWFSQGSWSDPRMLINCEVYVEGFDEPSINTVFLARPTMSKGLWLQMVGRGARIVVQDFNMRVTDIVAREPAGDDGIEKFTFSNGSQYYGEDMGPVGVDGDGVMIQRINVHLHDEFHLVSVMDDITKFHALVEEWQLEIRELTPEEVREEQIGRTLAQKKLSIQLLSESGEVKEDKEMAALGDAKIRDLVGVLIVSTYYNKNMGVPCDTERMAVLKRLLDFTHEECMKVTEVDEVVFDTATQSNITRKVSKEEFDYGHFKHAAYTNCVTAGEFPLRIFDVIRTAFYFRWVLGRLKTKCTEDGQYYSTWNLVPIEEMTPDSRMKHVARAMEISQEAKKLNEEFNLAYADRSNWDMLIADVYAKAYEICDTLPQAKATRTSLGDVIKQISPARVRDRRISFASTIEVTTGAAAGRVARFSRILTRALQEILDDSGALVTISPSKVTWDRTGELVKRDPVP